jgi:glutaminase
MESPIQAFLRELHVRYQADVSGEVATYIPELSRANPDWFGLVIATVDGQVYEVGDAKQPFTIQSISKPFVYGLSLEDNGEEEVMSHVGLEPSGDAFNAISLDPGSGRPFNPMINAGAIAITGLVRAAERVDRIRETLGRYAGRELAIDGDVFESERSTGHRNRAISHLLRNFSVIDSDPGPVVDAYFSQCSISVTCRDLAVMAATLANRGVNPITAEIAIDGRYVESVLSVMGSCGMYDYAGEWLYRVGMPAKSGVSGGVLAVLPGQFGVGVFSPPLDARGNSVRGVAVCSELSRRFDLHQYNVPVLSRSVIRANYNGSSVRSKRFRTPSQNEVLAGLVPRIHITEVQGDIVFGSAEAVVRKSLVGSPDFDCLVLDFRRVGWWQPAAGELIESLIRGLITRGKAVAISPAEKLPELVHLLSNADRSAFVAIDSLDGALEWCENLLLRRSLPESIEDVMAGVEDNELLSGLDLAQVTALKSLLVPREFAAGDLIIRSGDEARSLFLLERGEASVLASDVGRRLATYSAGTTFGEMAVLGQRVRTADVRADTNCLCYELDSRDFMRLTAEGTWLAAAIYGNLARKLAANLAQANLEIAALHAG